MRHFLDDIRYELRVLAKAPWFTLVVVATLALGIGVNVTLYSFVYTILLRPLPFRDSSRIAMIWTSMPELGFPRLLTSPADYSDFLTAQKSFESVALFENHSFDLTGNGEPESIPGARVSASLIPMLGTEPFAGRTISAAEDKPDQHIVVLSYGLWQRRYGGDRSILGKSIFLDRQPYTVIGVMPAGFVFPISGPLGNSDPAEVWIPVGLTSLEMINRGAMYQFSVLGKLKSGISLAQAQSEAKIIGEEIHKNYPARVLAALHNTSITFDVVSYHDAVAGAMRMPLLVLQGAVALLLLIAFGNTANLLLVRSASRQREMAVRASLGATRWQTARLTLAEGVVLAFLSGAVGGSLALLSRRLLASLLPSSFPQTGAVEMNGPVMIFTLLLCVAASLVFGLISMKKPHKSNLQETLQQGGRTAGATRQRQRLHRLLVVAQCGIALMLLIGAGLLLRSFSRLLKTDTGFQASHILRATISLPLEAYSQPHQLRDFFQQALQKTSAIPGVRIAGLSTDVPLESQEAEMVHDADGYRGKPDTLPSIVRSWIMGDYLKTLGIPVLAGRDFTPDDTEKSLPVALISKDLAQRLWPGESALGKRLRVGPSVNLNVVGVVGDVKDSSLTNDAQPHVYTAYLQERDEILAVPTWKTVRTMNLVVHSNGDPSNLIKPIQGAIWSLDSQLAITNVGMLSEDIQQSVAPQKFNLFLLLTIAFLAVFLAMIGIYGVVSYTVTQRTQEVGVRMALGATRRSILIMILRHGFVLAIVGIVLGLGGAFALSRFMESLLYGVTTTDALTFSTAPALLLLVALIACYLPARRAMSIEPNSALRSE